VVIAKIWRCGLGLTFGSELDDNKITDQASLIIHIKMDLLQTVKKDGSRGGRGDFKWDDVKNDSQRQNYLGHSLMARKFIFVISPSHKC
jgi:hypothetical protein